MRKYIFEHNQFLTAGEIAQITGVPFQYVRKILQRHDIRTESYGKYSRDCLELVENEYLAIQELENIRALARNERRITPKDFLSSTFEVDPGKVEDLALELGIATDEAYTTEESEAIRRYMHFKQSEYTFLLEEELPRPRISIIKEDPRAHRISA